MGVPGMEHGGDLWDFWGQAHGVSPQTMCGGTGEGTMPPFPLSCTSGQCPALLTHTQAAAWAGPGGKLFAKPAPPSARSRVPWCQVGGNAAEQPQPHPQHGGAGCAQLPQQPAPLLPMAPHPLGHPRASSGRMLRGARWQLPRSHGMPDHWDVTLVLAGRLAACP